MCGFVAIYHKNPGHIFDSNLLDLMRQSIARRGPDESGVNIFGNVAMAHQRLSIIDAKAGKQPMISNDGFQCLVYNGEIYNYREIKIELQNLGVHFNSDSDTEVLLKACSYWGPDKAVKRFNGMFAFVLWDASERKLFAARDRYGIKPLFFADGRNGEVVFSSDIKAIDIYFGRKNTINHRAIDSFMTLGYVQDEMTFFDGVQQLPIASTIVYNQSVHAKTNIFWSPEDAMKENFGPISKEEGVALLHQSVLRQSVGDVPIGGFLSGGIDSTLLTSIYMQQNRGSFNTYTAGFDVKSNDELSIALDNARALGASPNQITFDKGLLSNQALLLDAYTTPFADNAALPMVHLSKLAKQNVDVVLSGDGADELFFGYRNHKLLRFEQAVGRLSPSLFSFLSSSLSSKSSTPGIIGKLSRFSSAVKCPMARAYVLAMSITDRGVLESLYSDEMRRSLSGWRIDHEFESMAKEFSLDSPMKLVQYLDMKTYLPGSVLAKVDRATMAHGLEARVPYLDNDLVDAVLGQSHKLNMGFTQNKKQLRSWSKGFVNSEMVGRKKQSFTSPLDKWFRELPNQEVRRMILSDSIMDSGLFSEKAILDLISDHRNGKKNSGVTLWSISVLGKFLESR